MKTFQAISRLFVSIGMGWLHTGCREGTSPQGSCLIQQFNTNPEATTYRYDPKGRPVKWEYTLADLTITATYTYDDQGYLTASSLVRNDRSSPNASQPARQTTTSAVYTYTNGQLTGYLTQKTPGSSPGVKITGVFQYDAAGNLIKETARFKYTSDPQQSAEPYNFPDDFQRTWFYNKNQLVDYTTKNGDTESHPYTIVNGLVTKVAGSATYDYDSQRRLSKATIYNQGTINSYYTIDWDAGKSWLESLPAFKGFPTFKPVAGQGVETTLGADLGALDYGVWATAGLPKDFSYFADYKANGLVKLTKSTYTNQLNSQGYISSTTTVNTATYPDEPQQSTTRTTTYNYTGCN